MKQYQANAFFKTLKKNGCVHKFYFYKIYYVLIYS